MQETTSSTSSKCRSFRAAALLSLITAALVLFLPACDSAHLYIDPATGQRSGRLLYSRKCIGCHDVFAPASYNDAEWGRIMRDMAREAGLSGRDESLVLEYLLENN